MISSTIIIVASIVSVLEAQQRTPWGLDEGRIVGGRQTTIAHHPHQVSLEVTSFLIPLHFCGGSILSAWWVLTAAHCVDLNDYSSGKSFRIRVGSTYQASGGYIYDVALVLLHTEYRKPMLYQDISLVKVNRSIQFSDSVRSIQLIDKDPPDGSAVVTTGWGKLVEGGKYLGDLQEVTLCVLNRGICHSANWRAHPVTTAMLCAAVFKGGKDACQGDSGGPLVSKGQLAGVVSWGIGCAEPGLPGVYTDVAYYRNWISSNMNAN